ncbi:hypothetical protein [Streptomyces sp. NPDC047525]|uniref:hypothetical protein n=1 Tax=Streptomyces sp. NPDC047525 TaxID=3155264 RepID=UPI0033EBD57F
MAATLEIFQKLNYRGLPPHGEDSQELILPRSVDACPNVEPQARRMLAETLHAMFHSLGTSVSELMRADKVEYLFAEEYITGAVPPSRDFIDHLVRDYEEMHGPLSDKARTYLLAMYVTSLEMIPRTPEA